MGSSENETKGELKMTNDLVKILEAAKEYERRSMIWFEMYTESNDEYDWKTCKELSDKSETMLEAYEILTGKKIRRFEIEEELTSC